MVLLVPYGSLLHYSHLKISSMNPNETFFIRDRCLHLFEPNSIKLE